MGPKTAGLVDFCHPIVRNVETDSHNLLNVILACESCLWTNLNCEVLRILINISVNFQKIYYNTYVILLPSPNYVKAIIAINQYTHNLRPTNDTEIE